MTEQEIKNVAIANAEEKGFKIVYINAGSYKMETETEIIEISTTTLRRATVCINRYTKSGLFKIPTAHQLVTIGCRQTTATKKINQII